jgi:electron transport complex protein RnfD
MKNKLIASSSPHIRSKDTTTTVMRDVLIALAPAALAGIYFFGFGAVKIYLLSIASAVATEYIIQKFILKTTVTIGDLSAVVTAVLLSMTLPVTAPWWIPVIGAAFAIGIVKQAFGGIGSNFMNPALAARAFMVASWPVIMTGSWVTPGVDAVSTATPLGLIKESGGFGALSEAGVDFTDLLIGNVAGCLGETSALLLILGGLYLLWKKVISWRIPVAYIGTVAVLYLVTGAAMSEILVQLAAGGLMLGAFFMATDYVSSPVTPKGRLIFGIGCGVLTFVIRKFGGYPEGVLYSILLMNVVSPLIDRYTIPKVFGEVKKA